MIASLDGTEITSAANLIKVLWRHNPGDTLSRLLAPGLETRKDLKTVEGPQTSSV